MTGRNLFRFWFSFEDPVPPDVRNLDLVTFNFNYHDTVWLTASG